MMLQTISDSKIMLASVKSEGGEIEMLIFSHHLQKIAFKKSHFPAKQNRKL
jgi:hypothetical protein